MHALLVHAYHLAQFGLHVLLHPIWRAPAAALLVAGIARALGLTKTPRGAALAASLAVLAGWLVLAPSWAAWPLAPVERLSGLGLILLAATALPRFGGATLAAEAALGAWWLRGAPFDGPAILNCMPVFLGLAASLPLARRLARDTSWLAGAAAAVTLAVGLMLTDAAHHWARAAVVPAMAALAGGDVSGAVVFAAAAAMLASDRGREIPVDLAGLAPLLAMALWPRKKASGSSLKKRTKKPLRR
jgi:hypothetical protein